MNGRNLGNRDRTDIHYVSLKGRNIFKTHRICFLPVFSVLNDDLHPFGQIIRREMIRVNVRYKAEIYPGKNFLRRHRQSVQGAADAVHLRPDGGCGKSRSLILQPRVEQDRLIAVLDFKRCASNLLNSHGNASVNKQFR